MTTTFLFAEQLTPDGCYCLSLDDHGNVVHEPAQRPFAEIAVLLVHSRLMVVLPSLHFSLHRLPFPSLSDKKTRAAIPFALEEQLAQNVDGLHFSFDNRHYAEGHYLVAVCEKAYLADLLDQLHMAGIEADLMTLDWFALNNNEACMLSDRILVHHDTFRGSLSADLIPLFFSTLPIPPLTIYRFNDSGPLLTEGLQPPTEVPTESAVWIAQRLQKTTPINCCQGEFYRSTNKDSTKRWTWLALLMGGIWLLTLLGGKAVTIQRLNSEIADTDQNIARVYHQFFPQATQVISPKFRVEQLLKANQSNLESDFWVLLDKFTLAKQPVSVTIEELRFQNKSLQAIVLSKNFKMLEQLQTNLQQEKLTVKQTQTAKRGDQVMTTLELSL